MKIILINPPDNLQEVIGEGKNLLPNFEPLGILYLAAVLRERSYDVEVIDAAAISMSMVQLVEAVCQRKPDLVGITTFTSNGGVVYSLGKALKKELSEITVVLGNIHASVYDKEYLQGNCCDAVVHGEGEDAIVKIVENLENGFSGFSNIPNVSFLDNGKYIPNSEWGRVIDLSTLPQPARELVDPKNYFVPKVNHSLYAGNHVKHMFTSRGCPNRCTFCQVHNGQRQRFNSIKNVVDEIEFLIDQYDADYIFFMDSLFISKKKRVLDLCKEIIDRKIKIAWGCEAHVNYIDKELVETMEAAGCHDMAFGLESGVERVLQSVCKKIKISRVEKAITIVKKHSKILISGLFIIGLPGENYKDALETIKFAKKLPLDMAQFSIFTPYPGCQIYYDLLEKGDLGSGVKKDGSLDIEVWNRYSAYISFAKNKEPIWVTSGLSAKQLLSLQKKAVRAFYLRPAKIWEQLKRMSVSDIPRIVKTALDVLF